VLDTVTICPNQLGQRAALWGMRNLGQWLAGERAEILDRRAAAEAEFARLEGWRLLGCGAYFAYVEHPFDAALGRGRAAARPRGGRPDAAGHDVHARGQRRGPAAAAHRLRQRRPRGLAALGARLARVRL
jgi:hypothetical protein